MSWRQIEETVQSLMRHMATGSDRDRQSALEWVRGTCLELGVPLEQMREVVDDRITLFGINRVAPEESPDGTVSNMRVGDGLLKAIIYVAGIADIPVKQVFKRVALHLLTHDMQTNVLARLGLPDTAMPDRFLVYPQIVPGEIRFP